MISVFIMTIIIYSSNNKSQKNVEWSTSALMITKVYTCSYIEIGMFLLAIAALCYTLGVLFLFRRSFILMANVHFLSSLVIVSSRAVLFYWSHWYCKILHKEGENSRIMCVFWWINCCCSGLDIYRSNMSGSWVFHNFQVIFARFL